jgi:hypothetical protein
LCWSIAVAGVLAFSLAAAGCGSSSDSDSTSASTAASNAATTGGTASTELQKVDVLLPFPPNVSFTSGTMGLDRFFKEEGLDVSFKPVEGSSIQQLIAGKADYALCCTASVLIAASQGADLRAISVVLHDAAARLSVLEDSPIQSVADLKGKNVGVSSLSDGSVPVVTAALNDAGLKVGSDVHLVVVGEGGPAVASALKNGRIAAYSAGLSDQPGLITGGGVQLRSIMPEKYAHLPTPSSSRRRTRWTTRPSARRRSSSPAPCSRAAPTRCGIPRRPRRPAASSTPSSARTRTSPRSPSRRATSPTLRCPASPATST